jgi:protocatechuate 3,4-dioxygenase, beta subunit
MIYSRRRFVGQALAVTAAMSLPSWAFAEELLRTPRQTEGPFYPDHLPLDTDNDLIIINDSLTQAVGTITHLTGRVLDAKGEPVRDALVEIWQADGNGVYLHSDSGNRDKRDSNFQGYGKFLTGAKGEYYFRTIKPVPYPGRTPHIHFELGAKGMEKFTTQCYIKGEKRNERDFVLQGIGELEAKFDIVLGWTPRA